MRFLFFLSFLLVAQLGNAQQNTDTEQAVKAWQEYTRSLEASGVAILRGYPQPETLDTAEGLRYLLEQVAAASRQQLVELPGQIPLLRLGASTINKWGMDGADAKYIGAPIDGSGQYRFHGRLGSARLFAAQLSSMTGGYKAYGAITGDQLVTDEVGNFEVLIAAEKPAAWQGNWLALNPHAENILVREYFSDWSQEQPGQYYLERIDAVPPASTLSLEQATSLLQVSANTFAQRAPEWQGRVEMARKHLTNRVHMKKADGQGLAVNQYGSAWFSVEPGQALLIEMDAPKARLWSVQLGNVWWESLDYINHTASLNDSQVTVSSDGKVRLVLSQEDPGVVNWLDPVGHGHGALLFRLQFAEQTVTPSMTVVAFDELPGLLPADTLKVSAQQRREEIAQRRSHAALRWAP